MSCLVLSQLALKSAHAVNLMNDHSIRKMTTEAPWWTPDEPPTAPYPGSESNRKKEKDTHQQTNIDKIH